MRTSICDWSKQFLQAGTQQCVYVQAMASHGSPRDTGMLQPMPSAGSLLPMALTVMQAWLVQAAGPHSWYPQSPCKPATAVCLLLL